jgi:hypothetical protein
MKKLIISALIAVATTAQAQTTIDPYQPMMDAFDKQAEKIMNEFKAIQEKDPKGELPESKEKARILSERLDSLGDAQLEFIKEIIRDNKENDLPVNYIKEAMYQFSYEELKEALDRGEDIEQIMLDTRKEMQDLARYKQELKQQMHEMVKGDGEMTTEEMEDLLNAANKLLDAKGIAPMTFGPLTRRKIMMMRERESDSDN